MGGSQITVSLKSTSVSSAIDHSYVVAWDLGGRLYTVWRFGHTYRRGLDGWMLHKWRDPEAAPDAAGPYDERQRERLDPAAAAALVDEAATHARDVTAAITADPAGWTIEGAKPEEAAADDGVRTEILRALEPCARFDAGEAAKDAARFGTVYRPIGILPPDQYMSLVLQATIGCSFNSCAFCHLYQDPYRVRSQHEFEQHIRDVLAYLGPSQRLRSRAIFLGAANALAVPTPLLLDLLAVVRDAFQPQLPVHAFIDGFTGVRKTEDDYRALRAAGLRRVYVGLESGHDPLLALVRKPGTSAQAVEAVRTLKAAGLSAGVIVMTGLGGERFAAAHVADTAKVLNAMSLDAGDLVYFSELVQVHGTDYPALSAHHELGSLNMKELAEQLRAIQSRLEFEGAPPRFARYDVREFVY